MQPAACYWLGQRDYEPVWRAMRDYTSGRQEGDRDQIWFLEHPPVFTQGQAGKSEHLLAPGDIPVVSSDRGGQVTYHGPGQLVVYPLIDLRHLRSGQGAGIRSLVESLEAAMISCLETYDIQARGDRDAPGVYVDKQKIGSIGLRVRRQCSYHGISLNIAMDLTPFSLINPCGYQGLKMTQVSTQGGPADVHKVAENLHKQLSKHLGLEFSDLGQWDQQELPTKVISDSALTP